DRDLDELVEALELALATAREDGGDALAEAGALGARGAAGEDEPERTEEGAAVGIEDGGVDLLRELALAGELREREALELAEAARDVLGEEAPRLDLRDHPREDGVADDDERAREEGTARGHGQRAGGVVSDGGVLHVCGDGAG